MDTIIGIKFNDYVLVAAAGLGAHYYIKITDTEEKMTQLDSHKIVVCSGEDGPRKNFCEYIKCNMALNKIRSHGLQADATATANFMRSALAGAIRSRDGPFEVNSLLACMDLPVGPYDDTPTGTHLFYMDYIGTLQEVPYGCHGYGTSFVLAILDRYYRADMSPQEGVDLLQTCVNEVKKRVIISTPHFICRAVNKEGVHLLENVH